MFFAIILAVFVPLNIITYRALVKLHPRRRAVFIALTAVGNSMWLFIFIRNQRTDLTRLIRAVLGPPWFAWQCFTFLYCVFLLLMLIVCRGKLRPMPSRIFLIALAVGGFAGMVECLVPLRVERVPVTLAGLPPELDGMRLAYVGDLHVGLFSRPSRIEQIFRTAGALHPEAVLVAGDSIDDDPYFVPKLLAATRALDPSIPLIGVLGNHEMYGAPFEVIDRMRGGRIHLLVNEGVALRRLWIAGLSDYAARDPRLRPDLAKALAGRPPGSFPIVLAHQPKAFADAKAQHVALTLTAHSHGGQLGFRPLRWTLAGLFIPYHIGLYRESGFQLYVSTGAGYWLLPFRLGMTPEIVLIELRAAAPLRTSPRS